MRRWSDGKWNKRTWTLNDLNQDAVTSLIGWMRHRELLVLGEVPNLPVQQTMILERLLHRKTSCRSAAAMPTSCFYVATLNVNDIWQEPVQRRGPTHNISTALGHGETTSRTLFHSPVRSSRSRHRPRHLNLRVRCSGTLL